VPYVLAPPGYEEAIHTHAYQYIVESLGMDESKIFNMYRQVESIYNKDNMVLNLNEGIFAPDFKTGTFENDQLFLENLCVFSLILKHFLLLIVRRYVRFPAPE